MTAVQVFADAGIICHEEGTLAEGLELLAARLDYAGAGQLLTEICGLDFTANDDDKRDPKPTPTPKPPQPPKPPKGLA